MNKLNNISNRFKSDLDSHNKDSESPFSLTGFFSNKKLQKAINSVLLVAALGTSFPALSQNTSQKVENNAITSISQDQIEKKSNLEYLNIKEMNAYYDIDIYSRNATDEQLNNMDSVDFVSVSSGVYKNPFNEGFITYLVKGEKDNLEEIKSDFKFYGFDDGTVVALYEQLKARTDMFVNASVPNFSFDAIEGVENINDFNVDPNVVLLNKSVNFFGELDHIKDIKAYNDFFIATHETHHSANSKVINDFDMQSNIESNYQYLYDMGRDNLSKYDKSQDNNINDIEDSAEHSADFAASIKLAKYMFDNGESLETVNEVIDQLIKIRNHSIDSGHYTTPSLSIAKEIINNNTNYVHTVSDSQLFETSLNIGIEVINHDYKDDYLYKLENSSEDFAKNNLTDPTNILEEKTNREMILDTLFSNKIGVSRPNEMTLDTSLTRNEFQIQCTQMDLESGESLFPYLSEKIASKFKELGLQNSSEKNQILGEIKQESNPDNKSNSVQVFNNERTSKLKY